jgi:flavorubredoxin
VETLNLEVVTLDDVLKAVAKSAGFVIGSPTLGGHMPTQVNSSLTFTRGASVQVARLVLDGRQCTSSLIVTHRQYV